MTAPPLDIRMVVPGLPIVAPDPMAVSRAAVRP